MSIRTILVAVSGGSAGEGAAELACRLARHHEAHVEGLHARVDPRDAILAVGDGFGSPMVSGLIERAAEEIAAAASRAKACFDRAVAAHGLPVKGAPPAAGHPFAPKASAIWREEIGSVGDLIARRARLFDLVVLGRSERVIDEPHSDALEDVVLRCGRPVLLAPAAAPAHLGQSIAVAWNGSIEASRAVAGAMPFLLDAKNVIVLTAGAGEATEGPALVEALAWHGIHAVALHLPQQRGQSLGSQLLAAARKADADLLVMGGYGKAPWREMMLGGATRQVVGTSVMPILIAH